MELGDKIVELRKKKSISREELGKLVGTSGAVIGRYERQEITPSVEMANKIAAALGVSLDYLVGNVELELNDTLMQKVKEVNQMSEKDKDYIYTLIDAFIAKNKLQSILK
jgi:transcriptional regulator with XRE-family HTH domain